MPARNGKAEGKVGGKSPKRKRGGSLVQQGDPLARLGLLIREDSGLGLGLGLGLGAEFIVVLTKNTCRPSFLLSSS